jgi:capsular polysaccharide biosynthesis protein
MNEENIKLLDVLDALKKRWQLIVSITLATTILVTVVSYFVINPKYEASTKVFIGKDVTATEQYNSNDISMYQKMLKSYADVIKTNDLVERAFNASGVELSPKVALGSLTVTPMTDTQIIVMTYRGEDKQECKDVIEAISSEFVKYSKTLYSNANVEIIQKVTLPESPVSPNKKLNIAIAFLLGIIIGSGLALVLSILDSTIKDKDKLEEILGLPVLGVIPDVEKLK